MSKKKDCLFCTTSAKECAASMKPIGDNKYQCFKGHVIDLSPYMDWPFLKEWKETEAKIHIYKVELFIEDYSQQPVPLLNHGRLTKDMCLVNDEEKAKALIQKAKEIAKAMFIPADGELEQRFHQDKEHVVEAEYFVDNHWGAIGELFAIYSRIR